MVSAAPRHNNTRPHVPPTHVHYSNGTSGKHSSILHTILILHQVIITYFPPHKIYGQQEYEEWTRDERHCIGQAERLGNNLFQQRHTKSSPTIWQVNEFTAWLYIPTSSKKDRYSYKNSLNTFYTWPVLASSKCDVQIILVPFY